MICRFGLTASAGIALLTELAHARMGFMKITGISSVATRQVLADLASAYEQQSGVTVAISSVGGVDAVKRLQAGEVFEVVFLAAETVDKLITSGHLRSGSRVALARSPVAVAVRAGAPVPDIASEDAVRQAVLAAPSISFSTGPSGVFLSQLLARWGIAEQIAPRLVLARPGDPATRRAGGQPGGARRRGAGLPAVERTDEPARRYRGRHGASCQLPAAIACITTFSAGQGPACAQPDAKPAMLAFMTSPASSAAIRRHGMEPA